MKFIRKYPYFYEIPLVFALLLWLAKIFSPETPAFNGIEPHPFWLVIILFALRYGFTAGVFSALLAVLLYMEFSWLYFEHFLFEDYQFYILPGLFLFVGGALGLVGQKFKDQASQLEKDYEKLVESQKELKKEIEIQKDLNLQLEKKIVSKSSTLITLYEGARRFDNLNIQELYPAILEFVSKNLEAAQGLIYIFENQQWTLASTFGFDETHALPAFETVLPFLERVAYEKRSVSIQELLQKNAAAFHEKQSSIPVFMGPLQNGEEGSLLGVLLLYELPFQNLTSATLNLFGFLLLWASRALGRSLSFEAHKKMEILDQSLQVFSQNYFESRLQEEFERAKTYYLPLSLGYLRLHYPSPYFLQNKLFLSGVAQILKEVLRPMDVIAFFPDQDRQFGFMLITTSAAQAEVFKEKLLESFRTFLQAWEASQSNFKIELSLSHFVPQIVDLKNWKNEMIFEQVLSTAN